MLPAPTAAPAHQSTSPPDPAPPHPTAAHSKSALLAHPTMHRSSTRSPPLPVPQFAISLVMAGPDPALRIRSPVANSATPLPSPAQLSRPHSSPIPHSSPAQTPGIGSPLLVAQPLLPVPPDPFAHHHQ